MAVFDIKNQFQEKFSFMLSAISAVMENICCKNGRRNIDFRTDPVSEKLLIAGNAIITFEKKKNCL
jgi:hypothetical protein